MTLRLITAPTIYPVTLTEAKAHLNIDFSDHDTLITRIIRAATEYVDGPNGVLGRALIDQTWERVLDEFPASGAEIKIPIPPLIGVVSIKYDDADGVEQTMSSSDYTVDDVNEPGWVLPEDNWPTPIFDGVNAVRVRFRAGYVDTSVSPPTGEVPEDIKQAILLYVGSLFAARENVVIGSAAVELPWSAEQLLRRKRIDLSMA